MEDRPPTDPPPAAPPLSDLFEPADPGRWRALAEAALKGGDFERRLVSRTGDGIRVEPLYPAAAPAAQPTRAPGPWRVAQRVDHPDTRAANAQALADLEGGADALALVLAGAPGARGYGLPLRGVEDLDAALAGVMLPLISLRVEPGARGLEAAAWVRALPRRRGEDLAAYDLDLGIDPLGQLAATGRIEAPWEALAPRLAGAVAELEAEGFRGRALTADGRPYHEAGATEATELAAVLATALAYLRALEAAGHDLDAARARVSVLLTADADEFVTVAKLRAMRRLWARVEQACGLDPAPLRLHAETAWRMMTRRDPTVNILRDGLAAASAGLGGADGVTVLPYTLALGLPDAFARRVARNSQIVLIEEAHLARVADPAAGAGGFEALTAGLCEAAWAGFQAIEAEGGLPAALGRGALQARIAASRAERARAVATRRAPLTGASEFPSLDERAPAVLDVAPVAPEAVGGVPAGEALPAHRLAEPYEALRDAADAHRAATGRRPQVFLANLGPVAAHNARATFAANAFAAGGIEARGHGGDHGGHADPTSLAAGYRASGAAPACLCSSDALYAEGAVEAARALRAAGAEPIYLAGRPGDALAAELRAAGVAAFLHVGCDLPALLRDALPAACRDPAA